MKKLDYKEILGDEIPCENKFYKRFCLGFMSAFTLAFISIVGFFALLWFYDPFQFFHKPIFRETTYHGDMRIQAKGIIDNTNFDSVILGASTTENTSAKEAGEKLGGKWVNLSMAGSDFKERKIVLEYIITQKNIKRAIMLISSHPLINGDRENSESWRVDKKLYTKGLFWDKFKRYLDKKFINCAKKWSKSPECVGGVKDLETMMQWHLHTQNEYKGGFKAWLEFRKNDALAGLKIYEKGEILPPYDKGKMQEYVQKYVFELVAKNPQIDFHFIVPPLARFFWIIPSENLYNKNRTGKQFYAEWKEMFEWFVNESARYKNAKIYGFDDTDYPDTITNYRDGTHYNVDMNLMQLDAIANGTHILTPQNIESYLATMEAKIKAYDLTPLINEIKAWEMEQNKSKNKEN